MSISKTILLSLTLGLMLIGGIAAGRWSTTPQAEEIFFNVTRGAIRMLQPRPSHVSATQPSSRSISIRTLERLSKFE